MMEEDLPVPLGDKIYEIEIISNDYGEDQAWYDGVLLATNNNVPALKLAILRIMQSVFDDITPERIKFVNKTPVRNV